jgi:hypothetical protein
VPLRPGGVGAGAGKVERVERHRLRFALAGAVVVGALTAPGLSAAPSRLRSDEGCEAQNPLRPSCSFTVTHTSATPVTGAGGIGQWIVIVRRGEHTFRVESLPDGRPTFIEIAFKVGDKVRAKALTAGSGLTAGHFDP